MSTESPLLDLFFREAVVHWGVIPDPSACRLVPLLTPRRGQSDRRTPFWPSILVPWSTCWTVPGPVSSPVWSRSRLQRPASQWHLFGPRFGYIPDWTSNYRTGPWQLPKGLASNDCWPLCLAVEWDQNNFVSVEPPLRITGFRCILSVQMHGEEVNEIPVNCVRKFLVSVFLCYLTEIEGKKFGEPDVFLST